MKRDTSYIVEFSSQRFDYQSELPETYNAGNRFYGRDVAEFLASHLGNESLSLDFTDEDWGWLVFGRTAIGTYIEICVYNWADGASGSGDGVPNWLLWVRAFEKRKWLGLLTRNVEVQPISEFLEALRMALASQDVAITKIAVGAPGD